MRNGALSSRSSTTSRHCMDTRQALGDPRKPSDSSAQMAPGSAQRYLRKRNHASDEPRPPMVLLPMEGAQQVVRAVETALPIWLVLMPSRVA